MAVGQSIAVPSFGGDELKRQNDILPPVFHQTEEKKKWIQSASLAFLVRA